MISNHPPEDDTVSGRPQRPPRRRRRFLDADSRLRTRSQREHVRNNGISRGGRFCVVAATLPPPDGQMRVVFVISRRYDTKAVIRNRARRLLREAYRQLRVDLKPAWLVLIPRYRMRTAHMPEVAADMREGCRILGLLSARSGAGATSV